MVAAAEAVSLRKAHLVGGGIAGLAAAGYLIKDGGLLGPHSTIFARRVDLPGGLDAAFRRGATGATPAPSSALMILAGSDTSLAKNDRFKTPATD